MSLLATWSFWADINLVAIRALMAIDASISWPLEQLTDSKRGVHLAAAQLSLVGNDCRWTWGVLTNTPHRNLAVSELEIIIQDDKTELGTRIVANYLLWENTEDKQYLRDLLDLVRNPGNEAYPVQAGRGLFGFVFNNEQFAPILRRLMANTGEVINVSDKEFEEAMIALEAIN